MSGSSTVGKAIAHMRGRVGLTQRELGSKLGLSLRKMKAVEAGKDPKPCLEKHVFKMTFIPFLGYAVKTRSNWPIRDLTFDLSHEQTRAQKFLTTYEPRVLLNSRKKIAMERVRLERARRNKR